MNEEFNKGVKEFLDNNLTPEKQEQRQERLKDSENKMMMQLRHDIFYHLSQKEEDHATEKIVEHIKSKNYIYTTRDDSKSEIWFYDQGVYIPNGKMKIKELTRRCLLHAFTPQRSNKVIAKIEADTQIDHDEFFNQNYIDEVPVDNGILNIHTRIVSEFTPTKIFFNKLPVIYDKDADCPAILKHFNNVLASKSDVSVMLELFGYLLLKEYRIEKAFMFIGGGRNGKSKTIELMKRFIGARNCASIPLRSLTDESFSLSELFGRMANLAADLSKTDLKETGMIKNLIGRDTIQAKRKFLRDLNFVNYAKMCFAANDLPRIYDTTDGFWMKWVLLEFPYKFVTQEVFNQSSKKEQKIMKIKDDEIITKLSDPTELSGLLNYALDGLQRLLEQKDFSYSKSTAQVKDMWIRKSDSFAAFCCDHLEENVESNISKKLLRKIYHKYTKMYRLAGCSDKAMKVTLESQFGVSESQDYSKNYDRIWEGINFKNLEVFDEKIKESDDFFDNLQVNKKVSQESQGF